MMAAGGYSQQKGPWSSWRGGRGPNQFVGLTGAVTAALTIAILNISCKNLKEC
jgi:hypothetical protein